MGMLKSITNWLRGRRSGSGPEPVRSRETGGVPGAEGHDDAATTGPGDSGTFVGRISGQDLGYTEETGAERRARRRR